MYEPTHTISPSMSTYAFGEREVRVVMEGGEPLFHAGDLCQLLEHANPREAVRRHVHEDDVTKRDAIDAKGRPQQSNYLREPGMWALILGSHASNAAAIKRWVTSEVLPSIRRTGGYQMATGAALGPVSGDTSASIEETIDLIARMLPDDRDWKAVMWQQVCAAARVATRDELRPEHMAKVSAELTRLRAVAAYHRRAFRSVQETYATTCARVEHEMRHGFDTSDAGVRKSGVSAG